jgi:predicted ribosomally synthesized peptide with SipW-like signal peptide
MRLSLEKKVLLSIGVVAAIGVLAGGGTFATFTAQTTNPNNTFANGTLVLSNKVGSNAACLSTGGGNTDTNSNGSCDTVFNLAVKAPGDSSTANLTLKNMGSLAASALKVFSGSCTDADAAGENYHGTGSPCGAVQLYIQQYSDAFTTPSACLYGGASGSTCDFSDATKTLSAFVTAYPNLAGGLGAGALAASGGADTTWVTIGVKLPSTAGNNLQGRSASLALNWHIVQ